MTLNIVSQVDTLQQALITSQLLDYWADPSGGYDHSSNSYSGVHTASALTAGDERPNYFDFNGSTSNIDLGAHIGDFENLTEGTIFCRFKTTTSDPNSFFSFGNSSVANEFLLLTLTTGGKLRYFIRNAGGILVRGDALGGPNLGDGRLHDIMLVVESSGHSIYIDGVVQTITYLDGNSSVNSFIDDLIVTNLNIGYLDWSSTDHVFDGSIDRVRIFNKALTDSERKTCRHQGFVLPLGGQSNMQGRGTPIDGVLDATNPRLLQMRRDSIDEQMKLAADPLDNPSPVINTVGPALTLGKAVLLNLIDDYDVVSFVPVAKGGTGFTAGDWTISGTQYVDFIDRTNTAIDQGYSLLATSWVQGEADAQSSGDASNHLVEMNSLIDRFRSGLDDDILGSISGRPFVCVEIGEQFLPTGTYTHSEVINQNYASLVISKDDVLLVETSDLVDRGDSIHFDTTSSRTIGSRIYDAILTSEVIAPSGEECIPTIADLCNFTLAQIQDEGITLAFPVISGDMTGFIISPINEYQGYEVPSSVCISHGAGKKYSKNVLNKVQEQSHLGIYNNNFDINNPSV